MTQQNENTPVPILATLQSLGIPAAFGFFQAPQEPPYVVYTGAGQEQFRADNTIFDKTNLYRVEYYFTQKDEEAEAQIEDTLVGAGFLYEKSEDVYNEEENVWIIYYDTWRKNDERNE